MCADCTIHEVPFNLTDLYGPELRAKTEAGLLQNSNADIVVFPYDTALLLGEEREELWPQRERAAALGDRAVVDHRHTGSADPLADLAGESARALAVEIAFEAVADRFVQQHAGPAGAEQYGHFASRGGNAFQIDQGLGQSRVDRAIPSFGLEQVVVQPPSTHAEGAGLAPAVLLDDDRDIEPHQRTDVASDKAIGADDLDDRPTCGKAGRNLHHARIAGACCRVDHLQQTDLLGEGNPVEWRGVGVEMAIVAARRRGRLTLGRIEQLQRLPGTADRFLADFVGVGKAGHLAGNTAQAEPGITRIIRGLEPAVIESEGLAGDELHIEFAIVAARQSFSRQGLGARRIKLAIEQRTGIGRGHAYRYRAFRCWRQRRYRGACPGRLRQPARP